MSLRAPPIRPLHLLPDETLKEITLIRPDDWHVHFRDGSILADVVPASAARFGRVVVMPNLVPPVTTAAAAQAYRKRILSVVPDHPSFDPLMALYLTESTTPKEVGDAARSGADHDCPVIGFKFYPAGATTHSDRGVHDITRCNAALEAMQAQGLALLIHGEVVSEEVDVFDRERIFVEEVLAPLAERFPGLKIVLEHVTTAEGVDFVRDARKGVAATITAHHLLLNRNALFEGGLRPHHYCLPTLKRERHRLALVEAATSGSERFFLGTDSAPHPKNAKESACGCAGIYTAHAAIELYAEVFEQTGKLDRLEAFASRNGPCFYKLPVNEERMVLRKKAWSVPEEMPIGEESLVPFRAGDEVAWRIAS